MSLQFYLRYPKKFIFIFFLVFTFTFTSRAQNYALGFDGSNDYVDCGSNALLSATNIKTMECWVKFNSLSTDQEILSKSTSGVGIELLVFGSNLAFYCMGGGNTSFLEYPTSNLSTGVWYHIAATWNGTKETMRLYVNGIVVDDVPANVGNINGNIVNPAGSFRIGNWADVTNRYLNATIDEVRIWSINRTAAEIKRDMNRSVATNTTGLTAYYKANEGSGTTLTNSTANAGLNGTFVPIPNGPTWVASPVQFSYNALTFDNDDYVRAPANAAYNLVTGTVEAWVRPSVLATNGRSLFVGVREDVNTRYSFHLSSNSIGMWNSSAFNEILTSFSIDTWYHIAFVCTNASSTIVYVNGTSIGTLPAGFGTASNLPLIIGKVPGAGAEIYNGAIDEVRIWSTQRSAAEISANRNRILTGTETGLVALYSFDQGIAGGANTGLSQVVDKSPTNNTAILSNFSLTGTTSNYTASSLTVLLPVTLTSFEAVKNNAQALLQWQTSTEQNSASFNIERSSDGVEFSSIGKVDAAGNSNSNRLYSFTDRNPATGKNYYRLRQEDIDGQYTYTPVKILEFTSKQALTWYAVNSNTVAVQLQQGSNELYRLTDMNGRIVETGRLVNGAKRFTHLVKGSYSLQVHTKELTAIQFIVQ